MTNPQWIGAYRLEERIGAGGMGDVYRARGPAGIVAVKSMHADLAADPRERQRFLDEAALGERIRHPNIERTHEHGLADGVPYLVMEHIEGRNLRERFAETGPLSESLCFAIALRTGRALRALHAAGMVHRDIKPENIILTDDGGLKLTDLGLACRCGRSTNGFTGTVLYAAPEQFLGERSDSMVDWYALGLMLYELSTGTHPSSALHPTTVMMRRLEEIPPRVDALNAALSQRFADLVAAMLEREPAERFDSLTPAVRAAVRTRFLHSAKARSADELREHAPVRATISISVADAESHYSTVLALAWYGCAADQASR
jgi:serine/threonine-protein kinase